jgi:hypothetical protein
MKQFQLPVELRKTDVARIADLFAFPEMPYDNDDEDDKSDDWLDLGSAEGNPIVSLKHTEFFF